MKSKDEIIVDFPQGYKNEKAGNVADFLIEMYVATNEDVEEKWKQFKEEFLKNRFFIPNENPFIQIYLNSIVEDKELIVNKGEKFYRARIRKNGVKFKEEDLQVPPKLKANAGRLNPQFIPYLYISNDERTVISEVRPHLGARIVISTCKALKDLKILDLTKKDNDNSRDNDFRRMISMLFSTPYDPNDTELEYIPTQYIAEFIKNKGFDGVKYRSAMNHEGENICIFSPSNFEISVSKEIGIIGINYDIIDQTLNED